MAGFAAAVLTTHGTYWKLSPAFARLQAWLDGASLSRADAPIAIFYDDPAVKPPELCRYSVCFPLSAAAAEELRAASSPSPGREATTPPDDSYEVWDFPITPAAVVEYYGPAADSSAVYARLEAWIDDQGLCAEGPPRERYLALPGSLGKGIMHVEVQQPLER